MPAFLPTPRAPALNVPGTRASQVCSRRQTRPHQPAGVRFSATTDEAPRIDDPKVPIPRTPPRRPEPNAPPPRPSVYSARPERPERPRPPANGRGGPRDLRGPPRPTFVADPTATYYTKCGSCQASYEIKPEVLGPRGKKVACAVCGNEWFQNADRLMTLREGEQFKEYPIEDKQRLIQEQAQSRRDRNRRRDDGDRRGPDRRDGARDGGGRRRFSGPQFSLFIGNLPFTIAQEDLERMIRSAVQPSRVNIVRDSTGRSKGFAFADLKSEEDVQKAVNMLDGTDLGGRSITVRVGRRN